MSGWKTTTKSQKPKQDSEKATRPQTMFLHYMPSYKKCLSKQGGKLYVAFIDLRKAFDSVKHDTLLNMLFSAGISNTFITEVKAIYSKVL